MTDHPNPSVLLLNGASGPHLWMERFFIRAGFRMHYASWPPEQPEHFDPPEVDLVALATQGVEVSLPGDVQTLRSMASLERAPVLVGVETERQALIGQVIRAGGSDVLGIPDHLPEFSARVDSVLTIARNTELGIGYIAVPEHLEGLFSQVSLALNLNDALRALAIRLGQLLTPTACSVVLVEEGSERGQMIAASDNPAIAQMDVKLELYPEIKMAFEKERPIIVPSVHQDPLFATTRREWSRKQLELSVGSVVAIPIFVYGGPIGVLLLRTPLEADVLTASDVLAADAVAQAALRVWTDEHRRLIDYQRQLAEDGCDLLTGCADIDTLGARLGYERSRCRRYGSPLSMALLDIDSFRTVNQRLGQAEGDRVLSELGQLFQQRLRKYDLVARTGDDEFALVLPGTDLEHSRLVVERVRRSADQEVWSTMEDRPTMSAGVVDAAMDNPDRLEALLALASRAVQEAKEGSREDRIVVIGPEMINAA